MRFIYFQFFSPDVMVRLNEKSEGDTSCRLLMSASGKLDETALTLVKSGALSTRRLFTSANEMFTVDCFGKHLPDTEKNDKICRL